MKLHDKIRGLIKEKFGKIKTFHRRINELFGENAITYRTLINSFGKKPENERQLMRSTLFQIATALEMSVEALKKDTEYELPYSRFTYSEGAHIDLLNNKLPFMVGLLELKPGKSTTPGLYNPKEKGNFVKFVYCLEGRVKIVVEYDTGTSRKEIAKNENYAFQSTYKHHIENEGQRKAKCMIIQYPKYY